MLDYQSDFCSVVMLYKWTRNIMILVALTVKYIIQLVVKSAWVSAVYQEMYLHSDIYMAASNFISFDGKARAGF